MRNLLLVLALSSTVACGMDMDGTPPAAPTGLVASKLGAGIHVMWMDNSSNEDEFMIMRKTGAEAYAEVSSVTFNTTQFHDQPVTAGTAYTYQIWAMNGGGHSTSNEVTFTYTP